MAQRRMFSLKIIDTDLFLDMPVSARLLYYDLSMRADDDGFVASPKKIQRMIGASDDDFKLLIAKRFIIPFESGICVIKHWRIHNYIQRDRYNETIYTEEKSQLEEVNGSYELSGPNNMDTKCIQSVIPNGYKVSDKMDTQVRLGKDRLSKDNKYMSDSNEYRLAVHLFNYIKRNNENAKEPNFQTWAKHFDYILRLDKRDIEEVKLVIKFCQTDSFWFKNILSPDKLRKQYDRLLLQMKEPKEPSKNNYGKKESTFNSFKQRDYDFDDLKKKLVDNQDEEEVLKEADCDKCVLHQNGKCFLGKSICNNMCSSFKAKG